MKRVVLFTGLAISASAAMTVALWAQAPEVPVKGAVLHQDIVPPEPGEGRADSSGEPVFGPSPEEGQNPSAFASGRKIMPEPSPGTNPGATEPVLGRGGFAADRDTETTPDYSTGSDDTLHYVTVFNPSVLPWKRMSALDAVAPDYRLYTANPTVHTDITVGGKSDHDRDMFWGTLTMELSPGVEVPLPSVAPDMRILSYETEPPIRLVFSRDGADNFYARSDESQASGTYRLVFLVDADAGYFAPKIPSRFVIRDLAEQVPANLRRLLPPAIESIARDRARRKLGIRPDTNLATAMEKLTAYFRAFEAKKPPPDTGNVYTDLFDSQAGVCRHRSFAFMVTASALGIPTRYVSNEAHAFVEVWLPTTGWVRVDLGGAALRMQVDNASDKSLHQPRGPDPFAKPENYQNNYTQLEGDIQGLSAGQIDESKLAARGTTNSDSEETTFDPGAPEVEDDSSSSISPDRTIPAPGPPDPRKRPTSIQVTEVAGQGFRGETLQIAGSLTSAREDGGGLDGQRIDIWLAPRGQSGENARRVGRTVTTRDGSFRAQVELPDDLDLMEYEVYASTPGDSRYAESVSP